MDDLQLRILNLEISLNKFQNNFEEFHELQNNKIKNIRERFELNEAHIDRVHVALSNYTKSQKINKHQSFEITKIFLWILQLFFLISNIYLIYFSF